MIPVPVGEGGKPGRGQVVAMQRGTQRVRVGGRVTHVDHQRAPRADDDPKGRPIRIG